MATVSDVITAAMVGAGVLGKGQIAQAADLNAGFTMANYLLAQWNRKRWLVYHLLDVACATTGAVSYSAGIGGDFNTPRPDRLEDGCFLRQLNTTAGQQVDYPLDLISSREDYSRIRLKSMGTWPSCVFYDSGWPLGTVYAWPVPAANLYELHILVKAQLTAFTGLTQSINFPPEYEVALSYNLQRRMRAAYRMPADEEINALAKDGLNVLRLANTQVPALRMPRSVIGRGRAYNVYADD